MQTFVTTAGVPLPARFAFWRDFVCDSLIQVDCLATSREPFSGEIAVSRLDDLRFARLTVEACNFPHKYLRTSRRIRQGGEDLLLVNLHLSGTSFISQDGRDAHLQPGDIVCFDSTRPYVSVSQSCKQIVVHIPRRVYLGALGPSERLTARPVRGDTGMGALLGNFLCHASSLLQCEDTLQPLTGRRLRDASIGLIAMALGDLAPPAAARDCGRVSLLYRARALIEENLHNPQLDRAQIARAMGISVRYLQEIFRQENDTVVDWIWSRRLERCRRDLCDPLLANRSISEIAFACGFSNFSHFSRRFKAAFSMTASDFRRRRHLEGSA